MPDTPTSVVPQGGSGQSTTIGTVFADPLQALVVDVAGRPQPNVPVSFALPDSGASGVLADGATTEQVTTGADGVATTAAITANATVGVYGATATVAGVTQPAIFELSNNPAPTRLEVRATPNPATL